MRPDEDARRAYWREQTEHAHAFMTRIMDAEIEECGEPLVRLPEAASAAGVDVRFATSKIAGDLDRQFLLREGIMPDFIETARAMNDRGWVLRVEDGFRSRAMQTALSLKERLFETILERVTWECGGQRPDTDLVFRRLSVLVATRPKVGTHMSGSAIDISVLDAGTGEELDRGRPYLEMSELTPMESPFADRGARENRAAITALMRDFGFEAYPFEFWHYSKGDAYAEDLGGTGKAGRYGAVDLAGGDGRVAAIADPREPLISTETLQERIRRAEIALEEGRDQLGQ